MIEIENKCYTFLNNDKKPEKYNIAQNEVYEHIKIAKYIQNGIKRIPKLQYRNQILYQGVSISLLFGEQKQCYGLIKQIVLVDGVHFPLILIAWYYTKSDFFQDNMSDRQLFLSNQCQWQYVQSVNKIIKVSTLQTYQNYEFLCRQDIFFCNSRIDPSSPQFKSVCICQQPYNPDQRYKICGRCKNQYHPRCVRNRRCCPNC